MGLLSARVFGIKNLQYRKNYTVLYRYTGFLQIFVIREKNP